MQVIRTIVWMLVSGVLVAFIATVIGGLGNLVGAVAAGYLIGAASVPPGAATLWAAVHMASSKWTAFQPGISGRANAGWPAAALSRRNATATVPSRP